MPDNSVPVATRAANRLARITGVKRAGVVLLCDTSGSMNACDISGGRRMIDHLAEILSHVLSNVRVQALYTFDTWIREIPVGPDMDIGLHHRGRPHSSRQDFAALGFAGERRARRRSSQGRHVRA